MGRKSALTWLSREIIIVSMIRNNEIKKGVPEGPESPEESRLYELQASVCLALANPRRLRILNLLKSGEMPVGEMAKIIGITKANLSQHLAILRQQNIVLTRRDGTSVYYRIADPKITEACSIMRSILMESLRATEKLSKSIRGSQGQE
jgi:ArsR family transcriptional regulator